MKDIDFDELDRAVGSALGTDDTAVPDTPTTSVADTTATPVVDAPSVESLAPASPSSPSPETAPKPASPARRRGQFLDMVHPSANMRSTTPLPSTVRKTIAPINADTTPEAIPDMQAEAHSEADSSGADTNAPVAVASISAPEAAVAETHDAPAAHPAWPDPLDFASSQPKVAETPESQPEEPSFVAVDTVAQSDAAEVEPSQTPFVTDAKVDKRPLGAFAPNGEETTESDEPVESPHAADAAQLTADAESSSPEFSSDVNTIEAAGVAIAEEQSAAAVEAQESAKLAEQVLPEKPAEVPAPEVTAPAAEPAPVSPHDGVAQSIPQQYKTADVKKADDAHSLFDTKEYHQPLIPEGKKKSKKGVLIVVLLVVLLVIGGALGYVAYTMGI